MPGVVNIGGIGIGKMNTMMRNGSMERDPRRRQPPPAADQHRAALRDMAARINSRLKGAPADEPSPDRRTT